MSYPAYRNFTREEALDVVEAVERTGGKANVAGPYGKRPDTFGVSIGNLPDVGAFLRCCAALGFHERFMYSAGSGWHIAIREEGAR